VWEKLFYILVVGSLLFGQDFEIDLDLGFGALYPGLDALLGFGEYFFFGEMKDPVLDMDWKSFAYSIASMQVRQYVGRKRDGG